MFVKVEFWTSKILQMSPQKELIQNLNLIFEAETNLEI